MIELLEGLTQQGVLVYFLLFIVFVIIAYKFIKFLFRVLIIGLVSSLFPIFANLVLNLNIAINLYSIAWFAVTGMGLYIAYVAIKIAWKSIKTLTFPVRLFRRKKKESK